MDRQGQEQDVSRQHSWSRVDSDLASWMLLNTDDLFPSGEGEHMIQNSMHLPQRPTMGRRTSQTSSASNSNMFEQKSVSEPKGDTKAKKRQERLLRNREIARNCRKRKREKFEAMEAELKQLREDKRHLEVKISHLQKAVNGKIKEETASGEFDPVSLPSVESRRAEYRIIEDLLAQHDKAVASGDRQETKKIVDSIQEKLDLCMNLHSDFGDARNTEVQFHLKQLENLLIPNQLSKITLWSLQQENDFYEEKKVTKAFAGGLWDTLCQEFKLTKDQKKGLLLNRVTARNQIKNMNECLRILNELKSRIKENFESLKSQMAKIIELTTPVQQAKFLMWIEQNQACMFMLNSLWEQDKHELPTKAGKNTNNSVVDQVKDEKQVVLPEATAKVSTEAMESALKSGKTLRAMRKLIEQQYNASV